VYTINGLQTRAITASMCITQLTRSRALSASPNSLYDGLQVHLTVHLISAFKCISKSNRSLSPNLHYQLSPHLFDYGLQVYLSDNSILGSKCISNLALSLSPSATLSSLDLGLQVTRKMYCSHWEPPGVSERMWSVNLDASISGEYQTLGGHSGRPAE